MKKNLPGVFANPINRNFTNVQDAFYSDRQSNYNYDSEESIERKINKIFSGSDFVYKSNVQITTDEGVFEKVIVGKTHNSLLTMNNETIDFRKIKDIKKI